MKKQSKTAIAIGRNAFAFPGQIVINVELGEKEGEYTRLETYITDEEEKVLRKVLRRMINNYHRTK